MVIRDKLRQLIVGLMCAALVGSAGQSAAAEEEFDVGEELAQLISDEKYDEAVELASKQKPPNTLMIGWLRMKTGRVQEGMELIRQQTETELSSESAVDGVLEATAVVASVSNDDGIRMLEAYLEIPVLADSHSLWLQLVAFYGNSPVPQDGENAARHLLSLNPDAQELKTPLYQYAVGLYEKEQPQLALQYYEVLRDRVPETRLDPGYQLQYAHILTAAGEPLASLEIIDGIRTDFEVYATRNAGLLTVASGFAYENLGDLSGAATEFEKIVRQSEMNDEVASFIDVAEAKLAEYRDNEEFLALVDTSIDEKSIELPDDRNGIKGLLIVANLALFLLVAIGSLVWRWKGRSRVAQ